MSPELTEPWRSFLTDVDGRLTHDVQMHCCGGFVVTTRYGFPRTTADLDVLSIVPTAEQQHLAVLAGRGSELHRTHGIYLDIVTVATYPDGYESRLQEMFPRVLRHVLSQHFVDQRLEPDAATARLLAELIEHARIDTDRDQPARFVAERRPTDPPSPAP